MNEISSADGVLAGSCKDRKPRKREPKTQS